MKMFRNMMAGFVVALAFLSANPAQACFTGPMAIAFAGRTDQLTQFSKRVLADYAEMRGINNQDRVLVTFYGGNPSRKSEKALRWQREQSIRTFLRARGTPFRAMSFVTDRHRIPFDFSGLDQGFHPVATVELTVGCGN